MSLEYFCIVFCQVATSKIAGQVYEMILLVGDKPRTDAPRTRRARLLGLGLAKHSGYSHEGYQTGRIITSLTAAEVLKTATAYDKARKLHGNTAANHY